MNAIKTPQIRIGSLWFFLGAVGLAVGQEPAVTQTGPDRPAVAGSTLRKSNPPACEDTIEGKVVVDPELDSKFFKSTQSSYPWHIIEHSDGHLEDTFGGVVDKEHIVKIEHSAKCISSHQGNHEMSFCDGEIDGEIVRLFLWGGLPAYGSSLEIEIDGNKNFRCSFSAVYKIPIQTLKWKITKKTLRVKSDKFREGQRIFGWISVEFDEISVVNGKEISHSDKIEGYLKPVLLRPDTVKTGDKQASRPTTNRRQDSTRCPAIP